MKSEAQYAQKIMKSQKWKQNGRANLLYGNRRSETRQISSKKGKMLDVGSSEFKQQWNLENIKEISQPRQNIKVSD